MIAVWVRDHPDDVAEIVEIAKTMSPVHRDSVLLEYANRKGIAFKMTPRGRLEGKSSIAYRVRVTYILNMHPELFTPWTKGNGGHIGKDRIWFHNNGAKA